MKPLLFFLIAIIGTTGSVKSQITNDSLRKLRNYNDSFVKANYQSISDFVHRNMAVSKLTCYEKYSVKNHYKKVKLWGKLRHYSHKIDRRAFRSGYNRYKNDKVLLANHLLVTTPDKAIWYWIQRLGNYRGCGFIDSLFPEYIFLRISRHYDQLCHSFPANALPGSSYPRSKNLGCIGETPYFKGGLIMAVSKDPTKTNLIFSEEFCFTDTNWRFLYNEFTNRGKLSGTSPEATIKLYLRLYLMEYFDNTDSLKIEFNKKNDNIYYYNVEGICCRYRTDDKDGKGKTTNITIKLNGATGEILRLKKTKKKKVRED